MIFLLDFVEQFYSPVMAVINFVCFGAMLVCCAILFLSVVLDQFRAAMKRTALPSLITLIVLFIIHGVLVSEFGIPLLVPPIGTVYFTEFLHVIQYVASIAVVLLGAYIFACAALRQIDRRMGERFMTGIMFLIILLVVHQYVYDEFGILIIFPPNLW